MATSRLKHTYLQVLGITIMVLALVRCVFPGVAEHDSPTPPLPADSTSQVTDTVRQVPKEMATAVPAASPPGKPEAADVPAASPPGKPEAAAVPSFKGAATRYRADGERPHPVISVPGYAASFPDSNNVQLESALQWGVAPMKDRDDAERRKNELVFMGCSPYYDVAHLDSSIPYLVPRAAILLDDIGRAFFDSLQAKGMPLSRMTVSSVLRTEADVARLRRSNRNATEQSCHLFATTFDINYNVYTAVASNSAPGDRLKMVLAEVLADMRRQGRCYVKYELRQPCFHITVR